MSFLSDLGNTLLGSGDRPERAPQSSEERELLDTSRGMLDDPARAELSGLEDIAMRELASDRAGRKRRALGRTGADVAQRFSGARGVDNAVRRAKGQSRLSQFAVDSVDNQLLKDRVSAVGQARGRQRSGAGMLSQAAGNENRVAGAQQSLDRTRSSARENMFGTLTGVGVGMLPGMLEKRRQNKAVATTGVDFSTQRGAPTRNLA